MLQADLPFRRAGLGGIRRIDDAGLGAHQLGKPVQSGKAVGKQLGEIRQLPNGVDKRRHIEGKCNEIRDNPAGPA